MVKGVRGFLFGLCFLSAQRTICGPLPEFRFTRLPGAAKRQDETLKIEEETSRTHNANVGVLICVQKRAECGAPPWGTRAKKYMSD